jgi:hypothetical protein
MGAFLRNSTVSHLSVPRRRESILNRQQSMLGEMEQWIPACAGMARCAE